MSFKAKHFVNRTLKLTTVLIVSLLPVSLLITTNVKPAYACRCSGVLSPLTAFNNATAVFAGTLTSADQVGATFKVSQFWKGNLSQNLVLRNNQVTSCDLVFSASSVGKEFLVYVNGDRAYLCSRTGLLSNAGEDLAVLGIGVLPGANPIMINNPSFESPSLADGSFNIANITSWSVINTGNPGAFNPSSSSFEIVADGVQTLYSNGATVFQTLPTTLAPKTIYTLSIFVGRRLDYTNFPGFTVELRAGSTILASANQTNIALPAPGNFKRLAFSYTSPSSVPAGQPLQVRLKSAGAQTNFDYVTLHAQPAQ
jgi:hypothetical protein